MKKYVRRWGYWEAAGANTEVNVFVVKELAIGVDECVAVVVAGGVVVVAGVVGGAGVVVVVAGADVAGAVAAVAGAADAADAGYSYIFDQTRLSGNFVVEKYRQTHLFATASADCGDH